MNDLRFALRQLHKSPGFTAIAVLTLALGIGANTAIFSVVNAVLLRPLPYPQPERLVYLNETGGGTDVSIALPDYVDWRKDSKSFQHLAITRLESRNLSGIAGREAERVSVAFVTANFFDVIGLRPQIGRTFLEEEDKPGAPALVILSDRLWDRVFHRDFHCLGAAIGKQHAVVAADALRQRGGQASGVLLMRALRVQRPTRGQQALRFANERGMSVPQ